jgi:hypothetical protein
MAKERRMSQLNLPDSDDPPVMLSPEDEHELVCAISELPVAAARQPIDKVEGHDDQQDN